MEHKVLLLLWQTLLYVLSPCSLAWCTACCRGARVSVRRRTRSSGCPCSRTWSWSCPVEWPWDSAPAPTAPRPWAALHAKRRLPESPYYPPAGLLPRPLLIVWDRTAVNVKHDKEFIRCTKFSWHTPLCCPHSDLNHPYKWESIFQASDVRYCSLPHLAGVLLADNCYWSF